MICDESEIAIAGNALLSPLNLPVNSSAKCNASQLLPPFPHIKTLFPFKNVSASALATFSLL